MNRPRATPCPICRRPAVPEFSPFCCQRCADVDLGRWITERYAIPTDDEDDQPPPEPRRLLSDDE